MRLRAAARRVRAAGVVGHAVVGSAAGERECVASDARHRPPRDAAQIARRVLQEGRRGASLLFCSNLKNINFYIENCCSSTKVKNLLNQIL